MFAWSKCLLNLFRDWDNVFDEKFGTSIVENGAVKLNLGLTIKY